MKKIIVAACLLTFAAYALAQTVANAAPCAAENAPEVVAEDRGLKYHRGRFPRVA